MHHYFTKLPCIGDFFPTMLLGADDNEMASLIESRSLPTARVNFNQPLPPHTLPQQIEFFGLTPQI